MSTPRRPGGVELRLQGVSVRFGGVVALNGIDLRVAPGTRHAVIGPNGAGKSTLLRLIGGDFAPTTGTVTVGGQLLRGGAARRAAALGVARSFQTSSLFLEESVLDNVALAVLAQTPGRREVWRPLSGQAGVMGRARQALDRLGLADRAQQRAGRLSHGERRQLELAMVLSQEPSLLLLDEPLAGLAAAERERVGELLLGLPRDWATVLIEHDLEFCLRFADRLTVLHNGRELASGTADEIRRNEEVQAVYLGLPAAPGRTELSSPPSGPPLLRVEELGVAYGTATVLGAVSLQVRPGEVVAVLGRNGVGKTTLLTTLMGWRRPTGGRIWLGGTDVTLMTLPNRSRAGLALVPQGRRMLAGLTVDEELRLATRPGRWTLEEVYATFPRLGERRGALTTTLSGGEQQMVAVGRALLQNPAVLMLDEPTEGLSPAMVSVVRDMIVELRRRGETVLLAEQNLPLALTVADRVYVLDRGAVVFEGRAAELAQQPAALRELLGV